MVLTTRPVKAAGCRSRATPAWPLGVTSTSRVDRRDDGSPPERRSRPGGACAAKTVMTTRCPLSSRASQKLARISLAPQALGSIRRQYHRPRSRGRAGGWVGSPAARPWPRNRACTSATSARWSSASAHSTRLSSASSASASRQDGRPRRPVRDLDLGAHRPGAAWADAPRWGITYARFGFSGCPSRWRSLRGRTVRQ
jgi:hypothetical protein